MKKGLSNVVSGATADSPGPAGREGKSSSVKAFVTGLEVYRLPAHGQPISPGLRYISETFWSACVLACAEKNHLDRWMVV